MQLCPVKLNYNLEASGRRIVSLLVSALYFHQNGTGLDSIIKSVFLSLNSKLLPSVLTHCYYSDHGSCIFEVHLKWKAAFLPILLTSLIILLLIDGFIPKKTKTHFLYFYIIFKNHFNFLHLSVQANNVMALAVNHSSTCSVVQHRQHTYDCCCSYGAIHSHPKVMLRHISYDFFLSHCSRKHVTTQQLDNLQRPFRRGLEVTLAGPFVCTACCSNCNSAN